MAHVTKDVRWAVAVTDREAAPWFPEYVGKRSLPEFFEKLSCVEFSDFTVKHIIAEGDLVVTWLHVAFTSPLGKKVDTEEVQIWTLREGKIASVDTLLDTLAVAQAFTADT
jgi:ketosteroid isomerase-like protein